jgi:hypothetical protein
MGSPRLARSTSSRKVVAFRHRSFDRPPPFATRGASPETVEPSPANFQTSDLTFGLGFGRIGVAFQGFEDAGFVVIHGGRVDCSQTLDAMKMETRFQHGVVTLDGQFRGPPQEAGYDIERSTVNVPLSSPRPRRQQRNDRSYIVSTNRGTSYMICPSIVGSPDLLSRTRENTRTGATHFVGYPNYDHSHPRCA